MIIKIEQADDGHWNVQDQFRCLGSGATRTAAIISARKAYPVAMACVSLQAEEIPAELREIGRLTQSLSSGQERLEVLKGNAARRAASPGLLFDCEPSPATDY